MSLPETLTLDETLNFYKNLFGNKRIEFDKLDMAMKNNFIGNNLEEDNN